jgi:hypothetical protein
MADKHLDGPWTARDGGVFAGKQRIASCWNMDVECEQIYANAERIALCVSACGGIPNETLKCMATGALKAEPLFRLLGQRELLLDALKSFLLHGQEQGWFDNDLINPSANDLLLRHKIAIALRSVEESNG